MIIAAFVAVCGLAAAGWMRKIDRPAENTAFNPTVASQYPVSRTVAVPQPYIENNPQGSPQPYPQATSAPQAVYSDDGYYPTRMRPVYVRQQQEEIPSEPPPAEDQSTYRSTPTRAPRQQEYYSNSRSRRRGRSKAHSVEIVAGTAAAGAAIGAIAGGGKGAAIGALSGGGAGFAYDRLTHNK